MDTLSTTMRTFATPQIFISILVALVALALILLIRSAVGRYIKHLGEDGQTAVRVRVARTASTIMRYVVLFVAVIAIFDINGIDITALAAAAGVAGVVLAFALQDILSDLAMGLRIVTDGYFSVGQVVKVGDIEGVVTTLTPQSTKIKSILDGSVTTFSNRLLTQVQTISTQKDVDVPLPQDLPAHEAQLLMEEAARRIAELPTVERASFVGTESFGDSSISYMVRLWCEIESYPQTLRDARRIVQDVLAENGESLSLPVVDVRM